MADKKMLLVLDGHGGSVGRKIVERLIQENIDMELMVVGSNAAATSNMLKGGVSLGATGENAWIYNCARADLILGPIGIMLPNAMHGEISPAMALAVAQSHAETILLPVPNRHVTIVGMQELPLAQYLDEAISHVLK